MNMHLGKQRPPRVVEVADLLPVGEAFVAPLSIGERLLEWPRYRGSPANPLEQRAPLRDAETCRGHVTLVSVRILGLPIVITRSRGTDEYTQGFAGTTPVPAGSVEGWVAAICGVIADPGAARTAASDQVEAAMLYDRAQWGAYVSDFIAQARA